ncbi:MAG: TldD/PmbA family protein, partial [Chloroflexota bacterium]|nr:TldD/PmbA family protein [Chloroflexota bacterium]
MPFAVERDLARRAIDTARTRGATYADARFVRRQVEDAVVKNGHVDAIDRSDTFGFGVRVVADGAWGFAASQVVTADEADRVAALAVEIAKASAVCKVTDVKLAEVAPAKGAFRSPVAKDPFALPLEDRVGLLVAAEAAMRTVKGPRTTRANYEIWREEKLFLSSEGADVEQTIV